jgi:hypothetical protein
MSAIPLIFLSGLIGLSGFLLWVVLTGPSE